MRGTDVTTRSGGVVVQVCGARPRAVPVLARYHQQLLASAEFAAFRLLIGGRDPARRNVTYPLVAALSGGTGLPRLDTSRLRATWLAETAARIGLPAFMHAAGISCSQRLGDIIANTPARRRGRSRRTARREHEMSIPLTVIEDTVNASGAAPGIQTLLPACVRGRQLTARTLLIGMQITLADGRPAQLTRVHAALTALPEADQIRLGVLAQWKTGPHQLTYRQVEHTFRLVSEGPEQGQARRRAIAPPASSLRQPARGQHPRPVHRPIQPPGLRLASRRLDRRRNLVPAPPARHQPVRRPRGVPGVTAPATCPAPGARCSSATTCRPSPWWPRRTARPSPNWPGA